MGQSEAVLLILGLEATLSGREHVLVPFNSGSRAAEPYISGRIARAVAEAECTENAGKAEVLVAGSVPLTAVRGLVFHSKESRDRWRETVEAGFNAPGCHLDLGVRYDGEPGGLEAFRFRHGYAPSERPEPTVGESRLRITLPSPLPNAPRDEITVFDARNDLADDDDWWEDDPDARDQRRDIVAEVFADWQDLSDLDETGWYTDRDED